MKLSQNTLTLIAFLIVVFILGINFIFVKIENEELSPFWGAGIRYFLASFLLFSIALLNKRSWPKGKALTGAIYYGILTFGANAGLLYWSLKYVSAGVASITYATVPLSTLILASLANLEKITVKNLLGAFLVVPGIIMIFHGQIKESIQIIPLTAVFLATVCVASSTVLIKKTPESDPVTTNAVSMFSGFLVLIFLALITKENVALPNRIATLISLIWLILSSTFAFVLLLWTIKRWDVSKVSYNSVLSPIITIAAGIFVFKQTIAGYLLTGSFLVLLGTVTQIKFKVAGENL